MCLCFTYKGRQKIRRCTYKLFCLNEEREEKLRKLSFFGSKFTFKVDGEDKYKTWIGGIVSILVFIFFILSIGALTLNYLHCSMISDITKVPLGGKLAVLDEELFEVIKPVFWISEVSKDEKKSRYLNLYEAKNYLKIEAVYVNDFTGTGYTFDFTDCAQSNDTLAKKMIEEYPMEGVRNVSSKFCLVKTNNKLSGNKTNSLPQGLKRNYIELTFNLCVPTPDSVSCNKTLQEENYYFVNYLYNQKILKLHEAGRAVTLWADTTDIYTSSFVPVFVTELIRPSTIRSLTTSNHFKKMTVTYTFETIARFIRMIPFARYPLKLFYNYNPKFPFKGFIRSTSNSYESYQLWGGNKVLFQAGHIMDVYIVDFISPLNFLAEIVLGQIMSLSKIFVTVVLLFYAPFNKRRMKRFLKWKVIEQQNEVMPRSVTLHGEDQLEKIRKIGSKKKYHKERKKKIGDQVLLNEAPSNNNKLKTELSKASLLNFESNMEYLDEIRNNIILDDYLEKTLQPYQRKLLPIAFIFKKAEDLQEGEEKAQEEAKGVENEPDLRDIVETYHAFKAYQPPEDECQELEDLRNYIIENAGYLEQFEEVFKNISPGEKLGSRFGDHEKKGSLEAPTYEFESLIDQGDIRSEVEEGGESEDDGDDDDDLL